MATVSESVFKLFKSNSNHCDVTFKVKSGTSWIFFPAHKIILSIWSPVFAKKFQNNMNSFKDEIEITNMHPSTILAFSNYLYGSTEEINRQKSDIKFIMDLYQIACKYQVEQLKTDCCNILNSSSPNKNNVFDLLDASVLIKSNHLKEQSFLVLQSETNAILKSQDMLFTPSRVLTLLQLPSLYLSSEYELLTWVVKWVKSQNLNNHRETIRSFFPYLNFTALKSEEFADIVNNCREFFDEIECFKIFMNINIPESTELPIWYDTLKSSRQYTKRKVDSGVDATIAEIVYSGAAVDSNVSNSITAGCNSSASLGAEVSINVGNSIKETERGKRKVDFGVDATNAEIVYSVAAVDSNASNSITAGCNSSASLGAEVSINFLNSIEETERGKDNATVLEKIIDHESGNLWEWLEPPKHLTDKIKKKKIRKLYLLPERKSLPNIKLWDPELASLIFSGDAKSLNEIMENHKTIPDSIANEIAWKYNPIFDFGFN